MIHPANIRHYKSFAVLVVVALIITEVLVTILEHWRLSETKTVRIRVTSKKLAKEYKKGPPYQFFDENNYKYFDVGYYNKGTTAGSFYKKMEVGKCYDVEYSTAHINEAYGRSVIHVASADCDVPEEPKEPRE